MEPHTPNLRRYGYVRRPVERFNPPNFHSAFVLSVISDEPRFNKEEVSFEEGKNWKKAIVEEMEDLDKNEANIWLNSVMGGILLVVNGCSRRN